MRKIIWKKWKNPFSPSDENDGSMIPAIVRSTPFGLVTIQASPYAEMNLKMYVGNTNFDLTEDILDCISNIDGVETLEHFSPYTFHVSVGKAFSTKLVLQDITNTLCGGIKKFNLTSEKQVELSNVATITSINNNYWFIYILPNGSHEVITAKTEDELLKLLHEYKTIHSHIGGMFINGV